MAERPRILYVDDEKEITDLMTLALDSEGFDVTAAHDGQAAIEALSANTKIDVIVLDYKMPKLDGMQFLERVSQNPELHSIKVILCSAAFPDQQEWWNRLGGSMRSIIKGCVQKPCDGPTVAKVIHAALGTPARPTAGRHAGRRASGGRPSCGTHVRRCLTPTRGCWACSTRWQSTWVGTPPPWSWRTRWGCTGA